MTVPAGPSAPLTQGSPQRRRHSSRSITYRARELTGRIYRPISRLGRRVGSISHGRVAAVVIGACLAVVLALVTAGVSKVSRPISVVAPSETSGTPPIGTYSHHPVRVTLPARPDSYLGAFAKGVPESYASMKSLTTAAHVRFNLALYYSGWPEKFRSTFAIQVRNSGAVPFIQVEPRGASLAAITAGAYDTYLESFATSVAAYGARTGQGVVIGFGHEMNGDWYHWGYRHTSPKVFVAAWQRIVTVFRQQGADNVAWLWTVNIIDKRDGIPDPAPWWPGSSYVTWVGIDGYYLKSSWTFASLFGPTIKAIRALTLDPILIAETGATLADGQPQKIADLFSGVHDYGLLGFVWFDGRGTRDWRLSSPESFSALRLGAQAMNRPAS
jgi:mannan endo-1,4-beta-mannosidase